METAVCIVGAGPGGVGTALKLSYQGIPCIIVDKATFPRDKICGDAISGKITTLLNRFEPEMLQRFMVAMDREGQPINVPVHGIRLVAPNEKVIDLPFSPPTNPLMGEVPAGFVSKRVVFDDFLISEIKRRDNITFLEGQSIDNFDAKEGGGYILTDKAGTISIDCKMLVVANGAYSSFSRKVAGIEKDPKHYAGAVRVYYKNVKGFHPDGMIELHFLKDLIPGYFWVFPLPNNEANVGLGVRSDIISDRKLNLRKLMDDILKDYPYLQERFAEATPMEEPIGYGLPLGSKAYNISGDHWLMVGDAAHLVDPLTGEGIGNAFYSGIIAAEHIEVCLKENKFAKAFHKPYEARIKRVLGAEMQLSYKMQQLMSRPWIINFAGNVLTRNKKVINVLSRMYTDFELRKQIVKPWFWVKLALGRSV